MCTACTFKQRLPLALWLLLGLVFATAQARAADATPGHPKYIFFFIGDGMALSQRTAAEFALAAAQGLDRPAQAKLAMNRLPVHGLTTTSSINSIITDSGAAGTALACGVKTFNGAIGVNTAKAPVRSVAEEARDRGMKVGVVSSVSLDHATPACFYAHQPSRNMYYEIALQLPLSGFNYFAGGGFKDPRGKKSKTPGDKQDALSVIGAAGYTVLSDKAAILALGPGADKIVAINPVLDAEQAMPYALDADPDKGLSLAQLTAKGIEVLDNQAGFFMMVEGGKIDWACHANDAATAIGDVLALDRAVQVALDFADRHPHETLIVVTGDHETGGLSLGFAGTRYGNYYHYLKEQTMSFAAFGEKLAAYKAGLNGRPPRLEDVAGLIRQAFGLVLPTPHDLEAMRHGPRPDEDNTSPPDAFGMHLKGYELQLVADAFARSMADMDNMDERRRRAGHEYLLYGSYDPLTVTLTRLLDAKAGIGWTTYSHSGLPVATSAKGPGAQAFGGYHDNTELSRALMASLPPKQRANAR